MSMLLSLAKVAPELLTAIRTQPDLLDAIFDEGDDVPAGFDPRSDLFTCDYRTLIAIAEAKAQHEAGAEDWTERFPWLSRATGEGDGEQLEEYEFAYGPAFVLDAKVVPDVVAGLTAEGWTFDGLDLDAGDDLGDDEDDDDEDEDELELAEEDDEDDADAYGELDDFDDDDDDDDREFDDFVDLVPFLAAAAREGKAVVGGVE